MGHEIQFKGKIRAYLLAPMLFTILLAAMDVWIYFLNIQAGIFGTVCVGIYLWLPVSYTDVTKCLHGMK